jgi:hypothetical protein
MSAAAGREKVEGTQRRCVLLALLAGLLLIAVCNREMQAATVHRSSLQKPLMGG